jgi:hypothetical protein
MRRAFLDLNAREKRLYEQQEWPFIKKNEIRYDRLLKLFDLIIKSIENHQKSFERRDV